RLAALYADLLQSTDDPAQRAALEQRSYRLLEQAPANSADELRLALLRLTYRNAEKVAENHRLRLSTPQEIESAQNALTQIIPQLTSLRQHLKQSLDTALRRTSRAGAAQSAAVDQAAESARSLYAQCTFVTAWALYYQSWLNDRPDNARVAEPLFAELLLIDTANPQPTDVSVDLRSMEAVARSILGMALCKSLTAATPTAIAWLELLEHESTFESIRVQVSGWKLAVYLENDEYQEARDLLDEQTELGQPTPLPWLRLIAVRGLENSQRNRLAGELVRQAVTGLAAQGQLEQVLDLARRYGTQALGESGFALKYVQGVISYQEARQAHNDENPTLDPKLLAQYQRAADMLKAAVGEFDASKYPSATAACRQLIAWCLYFQSRYLDARQAFEEVSAALSGDAAAEALWMAVFCLDKLNQSAPNPSIAAQLGSLTDKFLMQYPSHPQAPKLRLRRAVATTAPSLDSVAELLAIPPSSDVYNTAQRRASDILYQLFRSAPEQDRFSLAHQFLTVAVPLIGAEHRSIDLADPAETIRLIARCRQILEVALTPGVDRANAARAGFEALSEMRDQRGIDLSDFEDEIDCRRVQERLLAGDNEAAATVCEDLWNRDQNSIWTRIATRSMFKHAHRQWKDPKASLETRHNAVQMVVRHGGRVLHEFKDKADALDEPGAIGYHVAVAEASMAVWGQTGEPEKGRAALFLFEKLLEKRPANAGFLRSSALLHEELGDKSKALEGWRRLAAGTPPNTEAWYEAKFRMIDLLASLDPARAREVMNQHKQLDPGYGPDPWGARLKGLDQRIPESRAPSSAPASATTHPANAS
ncbi:MAG: hypothetical protein L0Y42_00670, partial [Phycisphaerales bacterium]|nr:hypothetical protein [Phycisphaerales bacterium]